MSAESVLGKLQGREVEHRRQRAAETCKRAREADDASIRERSSAVRATRSAVVVAEKQLSNAKGRWAAALDRLASAKERKKRNVAKRKRIAAGKIICVRSVNGTEYRSVKHAADSCGVTETTIRRWVDMGYWEVVR